MRSPRSAPLALGVLLLALAAWLRLANFAVVDRSPDEGLWTEFGRHVAREGPAWVTRTALAFERGEDVEFPWPQRVAYVSLVGLAMRASGDTTVRVPEAISTAAGLGTIAVAGIVAADFLGPWVAVPAMLFLAVSPLDLALARRAWQDDVTALVTILMAWAFLRHARGGGRGAALAFFLLSAFALLVKESEVVPFGLGTLGLAIVAQRRSHAPGPPLAMLGAGALTALAALAVVVGVSGGWTAARTLHALSREALAPDDYLRRYQTGGVGYYLTGMRLLQPLPFLLGGVAAAIAIVRPAALARWLPSPAARTTLRALAWLVAGFCAVAFSYSSKNLRFLSPIYAATFVLAGALVVAVVAWCFARLPARLATAIAVAVSLALAASAVMDVRRFDRYFNEDQIQDLATPWFTQADADEK